MANYTTILASTLPDYIRSNPAVVYNNKIYYFSEPTSSPWNTKMYSWDGSEWTEEYVFSDSYYTMGAVVYNNRIHLLGGNHNVKTRHISWNGTSWDTESTLPIQFTSGGAIIYDNKIHIFSGKSHYSWDGTTWTQEVDLPYSLKNYVDNIVVYNNEIHIIGLYTSNVYNDAYHYYWNGIEWVQKSKLPIKIGGYDTVAITYNNKIHVFGYNGIIGQHYTLNIIDGVDNWIENSTLPADRGPDEAVIYDDTINLLGFDVRAQYGKNHYILYEDGNVNKVIYGNDVVIDISHDTVTSDTLVSNKTAHDKGGRLIIGTRPSFYKYTSNNIEYINDNFPIILNKTDTNSIPVMKLGNYVINLRYNSNNSRIELYTIKEDGTTESAVMVLGSSATTNLTKFKIEKVWYISRNLCIFQYRSYVDNLWGVQNLRTVYIKFDGTLSIGFAKATLGEADTSTTTYKLNVIPSLLGDKSFDFVACRIGIISSTNQYSIAKYTGYLSTNEIITKDYGQITDGYISDLSLAPLKGGYFYKSSGTDYIQLLNSYDNTNKVTTLASAGSDIAAVGVEEHYILGFTTLGYLLTVKKQDKYYLWDYDTINTLNYLKLITSFDASNFGAANNGYKIISYKDNIIICDNGKRYQIDGVILKELEPVNITKVTYPTGLPNSESDTINGVFSY